MDKAPPTTKKPTTMEDAGQFKVLIVGTGIAGAVLTYWLLRSHPSIHITLIERDPSPRLTGASVDIRDAAVDIIKLMGVEPLIREKSTKEKGIEFVDVNGKGEERVVARLGASGRSDVQSITSEYEIFRGELAGVFMERGREIRGWERRVEVVYGEEVKEWKDLNEEVDGKAGVEIRFKNGREMGRYDLLVGADGLGSKVRATMLGTESSAQLFDEGVHVAYFTMSPDLLNGSPFAKWYNATNGRVILLRPDPSPKGQTRANFMNVTTSSDLEGKRRLNDAWAEGNDAYKKLMVEQFSDVGWLAPQVLEGMHTATDFYCSLFGQIRCPKLHSKRVVLLGDAGYATPGIGTSLAIMGSYILAGELSRAPNSPNTKPSSISGTDGITAALKRYEDIMSPFVKGQQGGDQMMQYFNPQTKWGIGVRNMVLGTVTGLRIDRMMMSVVGWLGIGGGKLKLEEYEWVDESALGR